MMSKSICPHCGANLYGLVSRCYKCGGPVGVREMVEQKFEASRDKRKLRSGLGGVLIAVAYVVYVISGLAGFVIELMIVSEVAGFWGVVLGITLLPAVLLAAPWYALVAWGNWLPLLVVYGGLVSATILYVVGSAIAGD